MSKPQNLYIKSQQMWVPDASVKKMIPTWASNDQVIGFMHSVAKIAKKEKLCKDYKLSKKTFEDALKHVDFLEAKYKKKQ